MTPTPAPMVAFPDAGHYLPLPSDPDSDRAWGRYEKARADAWEQRARAAVEGLIRMRSIFDDDVFYNSIVGLNPTIGAYKAFQDVEAIIAAVGELPPSPAAQE